MPEGEAAIFKRRDDDDSPAGTRRTLLGANERTGGASAKTENPDAALRIPVSAMPRDYSISLRDAVRGGTDRMLTAPAVERRHPMKGFEDQYVDIVDYIVRITHRIWEEKDIGYIYDTYRHNSRVQDDAGLQYGRDKIVADTVHTINAFPDIRLYADEIIWAGNEDTGFFTSHRTVITGTNTGYSRFGPPTGKRISLWCIANCLAEANEIHEEWVIYNQSAMLQQMGYDLFEKAREFGDMRVREGGPRVQPAEGTRLQGQGKPRHLMLPETPGFDVEGELRRSHHYAWNWRNMAALDRVYDPRVAFHGPTDRELRGLSAYKSFILSLIAMFPDIAAQVEEVYWMGNEDEGYLASLRWSAVGTHRGFGVYGQPTGRQCRIWGINQYRIQGGRIREEWMMFNEFDLLQQIMASEPI
jgi:predicted ester cyclase